MSSPFGDEDLATIVTDLIDRMSNLEADQNAFKEAMKSFAESLLNTLVNFMTNMATEGMADALAQIPYIGPLLSAIVKGLTPQLSVQGWDGLAL